MNANVREGRKEGGGGVSKNLGFLLDSHMREGLNNHRQLSETILRLCDRR